MIQPKTEQSKSEKLADSSFALGIASIACGITALPAIIQSVRALRCIRKEQNRNKRAFRKAIFGLIFPACTLAFGILCVASPFNAVRGLAERVNCVNHMKILTLAIKVYVNDNNGGEYPSTNWCDAILANSMGQDFLTNLPNSFHCPSAPKSQKCSYAMNRQFVGIKDSDQIAPDTVLLFESDAGWNAVGGPEILAKRHLSGLNVALIDGSVMQIQEKDIPNLRWNPFTNSPAK